MSTIYGGSIKTSQTYVFEAKAPIDTRVAVEHVSDLDSLNAYIGLQTYVSDTNKVYVYTKNKTWEVVQGESSGSTSTAASVDLSGINSSINKLEKQLAAGTDLSKVNSSINSLETEIDSYSTRFDTVEKTLKNVSVNTDNLAKNVDSLTSKVNTLATGGSVELDDYVKKEELSGYSTDIEQLENGVIKITTENGVIYSYTKDAMDANGKKYLCVGYSYGDGTTENFVVDASGILTANNAVINGKVYAAEGRIGKWDIAWSGLKYGSFGKEDSIFLLPYGSSTGLSIANSGSKTNWVMTAGNKFGVDSQGNVYASNAKITGDITATTLTLGSAAQQTISSTVQTEVNKQIANISSGDGLSDAQVKALQQQIDTLATSIENLSTGGSGGGLTEDDVTALLDGYVKTGDLTDYSTSVKKNSDGTYTVHTKDGDVVVYDKTVVDASGNSYVVLGHTYKDGTTENFTLSTKGLLTADNANIKGKIIATSGNIGAWSISQSAGITYGTLGNANSAALIPNGSSGTAAIANHAGSDWVIAAGQNFGVTKNGSVYATGAVISGAITATSLTLSSDAAAVIDKRVDSKIANISSGDSVSDQKVAALQSQIDSLSASITNLSTGSGLTEDDVTKLLDGYAKTSELTNYSTSVKKNSDGTYTVHTKDGDVVVYDKTVVDASGNSYVVLGHQYSDGTTNNFVLSSKGLLTADNANITGIIVATSGNIGAWNIANNGLTYGKIGDASSIGLTPKGLSANTAISGLTTNKWVIEAGKNFGVTANGSLYATGAVISGAITATSLKLTGDASSLIKNEVATQLAASGVATDDTIKSLGTQVDNLATEIDGLDTKYASNASVTNALAGYVTQSKLTDYSSVTANSDGTITIKTNGTSVTTYNKTTADGKWVVVGQTYADGTNSSFCLSSKGLLQAHNAVIDGQIIATSGNIGTWKITQNAGLTYGTVGAANSAGLIPNASSGSATIAGRTGSDWVITAGANFGVSKNGSIYATGATLTSATISGAITASSLTLGTSAKSTIASEVSTNIGSNATISLLKTEYTNLNTSISNVSTTIGGRVTKLDTSLLDRVTGFNASIAGINSSIINVRSTANDAATAASNAATAASNVSTRLNNVSTSLTTLYNGVATNYSDLQKAYNALNNSSTKWNGIANSINTSLNNISNALKTTNSSLTGYATQTYVASQLNGYAKTNDISNYGVITMDSNGLVQISTKSGNITTGTGKVKIGGTEFLCVNQTYTDGTTKNFVVDATGILTANNAVINGTIYAGAGDIGGWEISGNSLKAVASTTSTAKTYSIELSPYVGLLGVKNSNGRKSFNLATDGAGSIAYERIRWNKGGTSVQIGGNASTDGWTIGDDELYSTDATYTKDASGNITGISSSTGVYLHNKGQITLFNSKSTSKYGIKLDGSNGIYGGAITGSGAWTTITNQGFRLYPQGNGQLGFNALSWSTNGHVYIGVNSAGTATGNVSIGSFDVSSGGLWYSATPTTSGDSDTDPRYIHISPGTSSYAGPRMTFGRVSSSKTRADIGIGAGGIVVRKDILATLDSQIDSFIYKNNPLTSTNSGVVFLADTSSGNISMAKGQVKIHYDDGTVDASYGYFKELDVSYGGTGYGKIAWGNATTGSGSSATTASGTFYVGSYTGHALQLYSATAKIYANATLTQTSDIRLKNIIENVELSAEQIANAPIFIYTRKDIENSDTEVGTSAQYWDEVLPEAVNEFENTYTLNYEGINTVSVVSLARKVVEQQNEINELKQTIAQIKEKLGI